ncbi:MAG: hypothetical protein IT252_06600 [Chitinophagaceae bacterium]|nr:hypothetical protein [Chitinophagaceae bacterium]
MNQQQARDFVLHAFMSFGYRVSAAESKLTVKCFYINNPDGTVRWIWPAHSQRPVFLRFYFTGSWKSKLFALVVRFLFALGLQKFIADGECSVSLGQPEQPYADVTTVQWALFTGTKGPNRKLVVFLPGAGGQFVKIPYGELSSSILQMEATALHYWQEKPLQFVVIPRLLASSDALLAQQNVSFGMSPASMHWLQLPQQAVQEWCFRSITSNNISGSKIPAQIAERLQRLQAIRHTPLPEGLMHKLQLLFSTASNWENIHEAPAHGDCTPWNMLMNEQKIALIDWELYKPSASALYDAFHFHYQTTVLIGNQGFAAIRQKLDAWHQLCHPQLEKHGLNIAQLEQWYLLDVISYYAEIYAQQKDWHLQIGWLLQTWSDALSYWLMKNNAVADRTQLIADISEWLRTKKHAAVKMHLPHVLLLPLHSDIDICMERSTALTMMTWLQQHPLCKQVVLRSRSNMTQAGIYLHSGNVLHIDAIWQLKRKAIQFMNVQAMLATAVNDGRGILVADSYHDAMYTWLFYVLNGAAIPEKYQQQWHQITQEERNALLATVERYSKQQKPAEALFTPSKETMQSAAAYVRQEPQNRGVHFIVNLFQYGIDMIRDWKNNRGFIITFSGVDGAGKSTIIEATRQHVEKVMRRKVVVLRHRPSLLPILSAWKHGKEAAEKKAAQTLPRQGTNKSSIGSLLRFAYYYADYLLGQFYIQLKYVMRGYVVLYDRYYFDFINDSKRSNIQLPKYVTTAGYALLLKPKLNFFLWATPEEILSRKQELSADTIVSLTNDYMQLFDSMRKRYKSSSYEPIHNEQLNNTLQTIFQQIQAAA